MHCLLSQLSHASTGNGHGHTCDHMTFFLEVELKLIYIRRVAGEKADFSQGKMGL